jgi:hypothetical protein
MLNSEDRSSAGRETDSILNIQARIRRRIEELKEFLREGNLIGADLAAEYIRREIEKNLREPARSQLLEWLNRILRLKYSRFVDFNTQTQRVMYANLEDLLDKRYEETPLEKVGKLPLHAVEGLTERDERLIKEALGVETVEDFATNTAVAKTLLLYRLSLSDDRVVHRGVKAETKQSSGSAET